VFNPYFHQAKTAPKTRLKLLFQKLVYLVYKEAMEKNVSSFSLFSADVGVKCCVDLSAPANRISCCKFPERYLETSPENCVEK